VTAADKVRQIALLFGGLEAPLREAEILVTEVLGITRAVLYSHNPDIGPDASAQIDAFAERRMKGEPMCYIIGHMEFMGLRMKVGSGVLIPRPETELMVEAAINEIGGRQPAPDILDLCTGGGCIAIALAKALPEAAVYGLDASETALSYAVENARHNEISNITFLKGDLFAPLGKGQKFDLIISNPPYIKSGDIGGLQIEIKAHEPIEALDGGEDGLDFYRRICAEAPAFIKDDGILMLEIGDGQAEDIRGLASGAGLKDIRFIKDYSGIERIFVGRK
jgi:release factor glutamine methyltransferase